MKQEELKELLNDMSLDEKIGQLIRFREAVMRKAL